MGLRSHILSFSVATMIDWRDAGRFLLSEGWWQIPFPISESAHRTER